MPITKELTGFTDEDDFVKRFLIPLFRRMGFEIVANYHGKRSTTSASESTTAS